MCDLVLFAGTSEGREIAVYCASRQIETTVCVATDYGELLLPASRYLHVIAGRQTAEQMTVLLERSGCRMVVDATHPYAQAVSDNISTACLAAGKVYVRILREGSDLTGCVLCESPSEAVSYLNSHPRQILLTVGSKLLPAFTKVNDFANRCAARVLPIGIEIARSLGYDPKKLIGAQGPFSVEENLRHLQQFDAALLVTKESGAAGGFPEKIQAARMAGATPLVITRPTAEAGISVKALLERLEAW